MKLDGVDLLEFLPQYMRIDKSVQGIVYALNIELRRIIDEIKSCSIYGRINELTETVLDELAWQFNVPEYIPTFDIETKRQIIKNCLKTHRERGTVAAVEKVICDVFGDGYVEEWFNYDLSKPYHFKVHTTNAKATDEMIAEFLKLVASTQNLRSQIDSIEFDISKTLKTYIGIVSLSGGKVTFNVEGANLDNLTLLTDEEGNILTDEEGNILII